MKNFVSTPIYYASGQPHLGHAYVSVLADAIHRYQKIIANTDGENYLLTGMDEHGQKIAEKAKEQNLREQDFVDMYAIKYKKLSDDLQIDYNRFIRTTDIDHKETVKEIWLKLLESGDLYKKEYSGLYCVGCEGFKTDKDLDETGLCPDHLKAPITLTESNWFFKLSKYQDFLKDKIESDELQIIPVARKNEILSFINEGLHDVSFSRSKSVLKWGIEVPNDDTQVMYVWCDALTNYLTAIKDTWADTDVLHVIGKDILRFHALYWPAMLRSASLKLPKKILVHGLIKSGGIKMSKSIGNTIDPIEQMREYNSKLSENSILGEHLGSEVFRYFVLKNISPFEDGDMTEERVKELYNADLANGIGNLVNRVMKLSSMYLEAGFEAKTASFSKEYTESLDSLDVKTAFEYIFKLVGEADEYMQKYQPFKVVKTDLEAGKEMLKNLREKVYLIGDLLAPFMPQTLSVIKKLVIENKMPEKAIFPRYE